MKTFTIIFLVLITAGIRSNAQIPDNGFEDWTIINNCMEPTGWHSFYSLLDSSGSYCPVTRSTDHYPNEVGNYSVRISNDTARWNTGIPPGSFLGWGLLTSAELGDRPLFPITGHPKALCGYYKFFPQNGDTMNIHVHLYKDGVEITNGQFKSDVEMSEWTSFQIYFSDTSYISVDSARISISAANEPKGESKGPLGNSVLYIDNLSFDSPVTSVGQYSDNIPNNFSLSHNYPNPFNPVTRFTVDVPRYSDVQVAVYNLLGQKVKVLISGEMAPGSYVKEWDGTDGYSSVVPNGIYFIRMTAEGHSGVQKVMLMK